MFNRSTVQKRVCAFRPRPKGKRGRDTTAGPRTIHRLLHTWTLGAGGRSTKTEFLMAFREKKTFNLPLSPRISSNNKHTDTQNQSSNATVYIQIGNILPWMWEYKARNCGEHLVTHPESDILECEVKWTLRSITMNKANGDDEISAELFQILQDDAVQVLHSICQPI